jgi:D-glycero-D-manno-heptose 1,7-bisphosphate phosphatase
MRLAVTLEVVLFDRDGTLVEDVPYNGDPRRVRLLPGVRSALDALRARRIRIGLISNQSGVARGLITVADVHAVNARLMELAGPFDVVRFCPHAEDDRCACRKPKPGMIVSALRQLGVRPEAAAMVGDIGADTAAGSAAGTRSILVPTAITRAAEVTAAPEVAPNLPAAVRILLTQRKG